MKQFFKNPSTPLFVLLIGVLIVVAFISHEKFKAFNTSVDLVMHTYLVKTNIIAVKSYLKDAEIGQRGYLLTNDSIFLQPYKDAEQESNLVFIALDSLVSDNAAQQKNLKHLKKLTDERYLLLNESLNFLENNTRQSFVDAALLKGKNKMDEVRNQVALMLEMEDVLLKERVDSKKRSASIAPVFLLLLSLFSIFVITLFFYRLQKETSSRMTMQQKFELEALTRKQIEVSEQRFSNILSQSLVAIAILKDAEMIVNFANKPIIEIWGKGSDVLGKPLVEVLPEIKEQVFPKLLNDVYTTGVHFTNTEILCLLNRNGKMEACYFNLVYQPYRDVDDSITGVVILATEVTEQVLAKKQIEKSEAEQKKVAAHLKLATDSANVGTWSLDIQTQKLDWSTLHKKMWGYDAQRTDLEYEDWHKIIVPADKELAFQKVEEARVNQSLYEVEYRIKKADNQAIRFVRSVGKYYYNDKGEAETLTGISVDVTERKEAEEKIRESEAKFKTLSENVPHMIWTAPPDGKKNYFNKFFLEYTGLSVEELRDGGISEIIFPDDREKDLALWHHSLETGEDFKMEKRLRRYDGTYRWHISHGIAQKDSQGTVIGWIGSSTEIEEQKKFTEALETKVKERTAEIEKINQDLELQNQTFEIAEKIAKFGSYKWDITTQRLEYSDNLFRLLDCEPQAFVPSVEKFLSFIHPDDVQEVIRNGDETARTGALVETPYRIISKTGKIKYLRSSGSFSGAGDQLLLIGTVQDISSDVAKSQDLITKNRELENANAELASFNYVASHDLQEPLRKIQGFSKRILDKEGENVSDSSKDYLKRLHAAAQRMQKLIESLLSFSRINLSAVVHEKTDLNEILIEVQIVLNESIAQKNAVIDAQNLPTLLAVPVQMNQLFLNLISNSLKYAKANVAPHIKITAEKVTLNESENGVKKGGAFWKIEISDNGIGFEQQYEHKIFEVFQRLHGKTEYEGTGIGLAICKKIVQSHNGIITATGELNVGTTFTVLLPDNNL